MLTLTEFARKHRKGRSSIHNLILQGRIPGAVKQPQRGAPRGFIWLIPANATIKGIQK